MKAKVKTIGYTLDKLDRTMPQMESFPQMLRRWYNHFASVGKSMLINGMKADYAYEQGHMERIKQSMRKKREKVMFKQWSNPEPSIHTQQVINDLRFGRL